MKAKKIARQSELALAAYQRYREKNMSTEEMLILLHKLWEASVRDINRLEQDIKQLRSEQDRMTERFNALEAEVHSRMPALRHVR